MNMPTPRSKIAIDRSPEMEITGRTVKMIEQKYPDMDPKAMVRIINEDKRALAKEIHDSLDDKMKRLYPTDALEKKLDKISEQISGYQKVGKEAKKDGWIMKGLKGITYPIRHPIKTATFLLKAALVTAVVAAIGAIVGGYFFGGVENFLQKVGLSRLTGARNAAQPTGRLTTGPYVTRVPTNPNPVDAGGPVLPGQQVGGPVSPGQTPDTVGGGSFMDYFRRLWSPGPGVQPPVQNPQQGNPQVLPVLPSNPNVLD